MIRVKTKKGKTKKGYYVKKFNPDKHELCPPSSISTIPNELTLTCKKCGGKQTYSTKYTYRRAMGLGPDGTQKNKGMCGKCSRRESRNHPFKNMSKGKLEELKLKGYNDYYNTNFKTLDEYKRWYRENRIELASYKNYRKAVERMSKRQLKVHRPQVYRRYMNNKWDGTDVNQLTIDHIKEVWECYQDGLSREEASHIDNLQVITMKENINKHNSRRVI